ncbi:MAG: MBL fold metallo-hydrolase [Gemmataceae bacterium]
MKRLVLLILIVPCLTLVVQALPQEAQEKKGKDTKKEVDKKNGKDKKENKKPTLTVRYLAHAMFQVTSSKGTKIVFDPHMIDEYRAEKQSVEADIAIVSHNHNDHSQVKTRIKPRPKMQTLVGVQGGERMQRWTLVKKKKIKDVQIDMVATYHDEVEGRDRGKNALTIVRVDGYSILNLGDLGHTLTRANLRNIKNIVKQVDIVMIPVGGIYTLNGDGAIKVVKQLEPRYAVFPMHYGTPVFDYCLTEEEFVEGFREKQVVRTKSTTYKFQVGAEPPARHQVVVLNWQQPENQKKKN